jgi:hypothetical protein
VATFVPTILPALDALRGIGGLLGLRVFTVTVRRRVWTGSRPGLPGTTKTDTDTVLYNQAADGSLQHVRVRQVTRREVMSSGGQLADRDLRVGPMTPSYAAALGLAAGGFTDATVNPAPTANATEMIWILTANDGQSHGLPAAGVVCELRGQESTPLHLIVFLRATGRQPT